MRVLASIFIGTAMLAAPAMAQNSAASAGNHAASAQQPTAKVKKAPKPAGDKICERLSQGKVCMTAAQWKAYWEQF